MEGVRVAVGGGGHLGWKMGLGTIMEGEGKYVWHWNSGIIILVLLILSPCIYLPCYL